MEASIIRIPPHHYIHVLDQNTNIARVEIGPLTYIRQDNERSRTLKMICSGTLEGTVIKGTFRRNLRNNLKKQPAG